MTNKQDDVKAAKEYSIKFYTPHESMRRISFLAGCEHKQKDIDELVEILYWFDRDLLSENDAQHILDLIQKHVK